MKFTMEYKGFKAQVMEAQRLRGERVFELPKGVPLETYHVDEFLHPPENWMKGPGVFVVPVRPEKGLWFNWRDNDELNTAVIPTVKGCNPITGLQTTGFHMEKYENKCPKHNCDFMADRYCPECDFKWPDRNFCSRGPLWWDGFRADDGTVRQFFFSEEELRDVASKMIGKENTVPAFGFAFYTQKETKVDNSRGVTRGISSAPMTINNTYMHSLIGDSGSVSVKSFDSGGPFQIYNTSLSDHENNTNNSGDTVGKGGSDIKLGDKGHPGTPGESGISGQSMKGETDSMKLYSTGNVGVGTPSPSKKLEIRPDSLMEFSPEKQVTLGSGFKGSRPKRFAGEMRKREFSLKERGIVSHEQKSKIVQDYINKEPKNIKKLAASMEQPLRLRSDRRKNVEVSIGAGAKIRQALNADNYPLDSWKEAPDASMTIYFVFQEKFEELKAKGMRDLSGVPEGMLKDVPVG